MEGAIDNIDMLFKKQSEFKTGKLIQKIKNSKTFLAIIMLAIGVSWTVAYYEGRGLWQEFFSPEILSFTNTNVVMAAEVAEIKVEDQKENAEEVKEEEIESYQLSTIKRISKENNIDWKLVYAVCLKESGCNPSLNCEKQYGKCDGGKSFGAYQIYNPSLDLERKRMAENFEEATLWTIKHGTKYKDNPALFFKNHNGIAKTTNQWYVDGAMQIYEDLKK